MVDYDDGTRRTVLGRGFRNFDGSCGSIMTADTDYTGDGRPELVVRTYGSHCLAITTFSYVRGSWREVFSVPVCRDGSFGLVIPPPE